MDLKGRAVWVRAVEPFLNRDDVAQILIAVAREDVEDFKLKFQANLAFMDVEIVIGGKERADTVQNALAKVNDNVDTIAIHDAARPLIVKAWVDQVFEASQKYDAVIPAVPVSSTLKRVSSNRIVEETVPRNDLWLAQTPQVFRRELLQKAFAERGNFEGTDEAQLVEKMGHPVHIVEGWPMNRKITTFADFKMAEALLNALPKPSVLKSLHPFADEEPRFL